MWDRNLADMLEVLKVQMLAPQWDFELNICSRSQRNQKVNFTNSITRHLVGVKDVGDAKTNQSCPHAYHQDAKTTDELDLHWVLVRDFESE